jgi:hypothetical protein
MQNNFSTHKYWIIAGIVIIALIIVLYPFSSYDGLSMNVTRPQAIEIAKDFLAKQNINVQGFNEEAFLDNSPVEIRYILKKLGTEAFKEYNKGKRWSNISWHVVFHQNLPKQIEQTTVEVHVSSDGMVFGFKKEIPDTISLPSLDKIQAAEMITNYLKNEIGTEFEQYKLIESKEENFRNRTDHSYRWEKEEPSLNAKIVITAHITGNLIGSYNHYFEVPQSDREYFEAIEALYGTVSVIFVIFLMIIAFYLFLKKYHQGEVWVSLGRSIFILFFVLSVLNTINYWPGMGWGASLGNLSFLNVKIIIFVINGLIFSFFLGLLIFAAWTVGESYARSLWPNKLKGIDAFIKGHFYSLDSGTSLMKGFVLGAALALSFLVVGILVNRPDAKIFLSPAGNYEIYTPWIPGAAIILDAATMASLAGIAVTFFIVNISYQRWKRKWISILLSGLVTTLGYIIASTPPSLNVFSINLLAGFIFGCGIAYIYFL